MIINYHFINIPDEDFCINILKEIKESQGITCKKCSSKEYYWKQDKKVFECKHCNYRSSLKAGTIMNRSRLPIHYWVVAVNIILYNSSEITIKDIQKKLNHNRYEPILELCNTIKIQLKRFFSQKELISPVKSWEDFSLDNQNVCTIIKLNQESKKVIDHALIKLYLEWLSKSPQTYN